MNNIGDLKTKKEIRETVQKYKQMAVDMMPIKDKNDYFISGTFAISAGLLMLDDYLIMDSKTPEEFKETQDFIVEFLGQQILRVKKAGFQSKKTAKSENVIVANFARSEVLNDK